MSRNKIYDEETKARMLELPLVERLSTLLLSLIVANDRKTRASIKGFLTASVMMAKITDPLERGAIVDDIRNAADELERTLIAEPL